MNELLHRIVDLCIELESGATHTICDIAPHVNSVNVIVWEGKELNRESTLYSEYTWYDGQLKNEKKVNDIIRALEELLEEQKSWEG